MIDKKTVTLYASSNLNGDRVEDAVESFKAALIALENAGVQTGRVVLFDTLEVSIDRDTVDDRSFGQSSGPVETVSTITVQALAVRK